MQDPGPVGTFSSQAIAVQRTGAYERLSSNNFLLTTTASQPIPQRLTPERHAGLDQSTAALQLPHWGGADPSAPAAKASVAAADSAVL
jgi:hypothetical protein